MNRKNQFIERPLKPTFGYILSSDHDLRNNRTTTSNSQQMNQNLLSPVLSDPRHHSPLSSPNGLSPSHSPVSFNYSTVPKRTPQTYRKIDSYYRKTDDNYLKSVPKTERQKSKIKRIAQLDDAIFELEQMYKKLKLSDQDLLDRAERREKFQLMRFSSASQIAPIHSPTQVVKSDEELQQQRAKLINQSNNELNRRRPISAFYNQFQQKTTPMRRSTIPDLIGDDQAVRRLNSPLPPKTPTSSFQTLNQNTVTPSYLEKTAAYSNPLQMAHSNKKNIYGHLEFDPVVDDVQYRKLSQSQSNVPAPHPPVGIPINSATIKPNPINDYLHSKNLKSNDLAVRSLRKDKEYTVNQSNPFANVLHRSSSHNFFQPPQQQNSIDDDLLPETTSNYLVNVKKQLKPTRSMTFVSNDQMNNNNQYLEQFNQQQQFNQQSQNQFKDSNKSNNTKQVLSRRPFVKSNSLSNCLLVEKQDNQQFTNQQQTPQQIKPKNNIYKKQSILRNDEEQLEDMLSNLNSQVPKTKSPDVVSMNKLGIVNRINEPKLSVQSNAQFGLSKSPTELINENRPKVHKALLKSRTQGSLANEELRTKSISDKVERIQKFEPKLIDNELKQSEVKSIWPKKLKNKVKTDSQSDWPSINSQISPQINSQPNQITQPLNSSQQVKLQNKSQLNSSRAVIDSQIDQTFKPNEQRPTNKTKQYFFMKTSSDQSTGPNTVSYEQFLPKRSNTQVNSMKNLFESKLNEHLYNNRDRFRSTPKKSSTQPNLINYNYTLNESTDKRQRKPSNLRKLKSAHSLSNRSQPFFKSNIKSNYKTDEQLQFTDESEHETSSSSSSLSSRPEF